MSNYKIVTPTPGIDELEEGDRATYVAMQEGRWELFSYVILNQRGISILRGMEGLRILEVWREPKPKYYPRFVPLRGGPGTGDLDSFRDLGVESATPAVAVPKAEWEALVEEFDEQGTSFRAANLIEAWKELTGNE